MAENLNKKPTKSILKSPSSFESNETNKSNSANLKFDEMNILQTLHPPEKDYGFMKIDEPKTPYSYYDEKSEKEVSERGNDELDASELADKMSQYDEKTDRPTVLKSSDEEEEDDENLTEEEKAAKSAFEYKRKMHYNEFYAVKLARKLIDKDSDEELDETEENNEENKEDNIEDK